MKKTMFEVNWHYEDAGEDGLGSFSHCTVTPIQVIREGVLPGCTRPSITAVDIDGRQFQGSPGNYHNTESAAWREVSETLENMVSGYEASIAVLTAKAKKAREYLEIIQPLTHVGPKKKGGKP